MSAERLREAAALMRSRAEAATPGPWGYYGHSIIRPSELRDGEAPSYSAAYHKEDAEHIASMHPAVALAVADLLERAANDHDETPCPAIDAALAVADAYLGATS